MKHWHRTLLLPQVPSAPRAQLHLPQIHSRHWALPYPQVQLHPLQVCPRPQTIFPRLRFHCRPHGHTRPHARVRTHPRPRPPHRHTRRRAAYSDTSSGKPAATGPACPGFSNFSFYKLLPFFANLTDAKYPAAGLSWRGAGRALDPLLCVTALSDGLPSSSSRANIASRRRCPRRTASPLADTACRINLPLQNHMVGLSFGRIYHSASPEGTGETGAYPH